MRLTTRDALQTTLKALIRDYWFEALVLVLGLCAINAIFFADAFRGDAIKPGAAGLLGDFVGGYVGTFFALASVVLLTATLKSQRRAGQLLNFETKYFELLRLHRDNVAELEVQDVRGRRLFVMLLREFRAALDVTKLMADAHKQKLSQRQLVHIAYYCVFYGTGPHSTRMLMNSLAEFDQSLVADLARELNTDLVKDQVKSVKKLAYVPFEGHLSRLGHYYRHLYQAVGYVDQQTIRMDKYEYVKTIRAQLSNQEQAMLLLNSLTPIGAAWWKRGFMVDYRMVQNIPHEFLDPVAELDVSSLFPKRYFEWEELGDAAASAGRS
jgi:hypothetical protein